MNIRKISFWLHLSAGTVAGSVILVTCVTGAALGFEKQIVRWSVRNERSVAEIQGAHRLPMETLLPQALLREPDQVTSVTWRSGRSGSTARPPWWMATFTVRPSSAGSP